MGGGGRANESFGMETIMSALGEQDMGNVFGLVRGGLYGSRPSRSLTKARLYPPRDPRFARRIAGIVARWKRTGGNGSYASRSIANTAQGLVFPCSRLDRMMRDAIDADVPVERVEELGYALLDRCRELYAMKRKLKPAA